MRFIFLLILFAQTILFTSLIRSQNEPLSIVGQWPFGQSITAISQGSYLYSGDGSAIEIYDVSFPQSPLKLNEIILTTTIEDLFYENNLLYVANSHGGFHIYDVSNPIDPQKVGSYDFGGHIVKWVEVIDNIAYTIVLPNLHLIDVSNPYQPNIIGTYEFNDIIHDLFLDGNYAYVSCNSTGVNILNISNPTSIELVAVFNENGLSYGVSVYGDHAFLLDAHDGLKIYDVVNPSTPLLRNTLGSYATPGDLVIENELAFITMPFMGENFPYGLKILDISVPSDPIEISSLPLYSAFDVSLNQNIAFIISRREGIQIVDVGNPYDPELIQTLDSGGEFRSVDFSNNFAFFANHSQGMRIFDISNPTTPIQVSIFSEVDQLQGLTVVDGYAYLADFFDFLIVDISDPYNPSKIGELSNLCTYGDASGDVIVVDTIVYFAASSNGLKIINASIKQQPVLMSEWSNGYDSRGLFIKDNLLYQANGWNGLTIIDVSDPYNPYEIGHYSNGEYGSDIIVRGDFAFLAQNYGGNVILDVSNPTDPTVVSSPPAAAFNIDLFENYLFIGGPITRVFDISDPYNPVNLGYLDNVFVVMNNSFYSDHLYVMTWSSGLYVCTINNPSTISFVDIQLDDFTLHHNFPNPFNPVTIIKYQIPELSFVTLKVYDVLGTEVATLVNEEKSAGSYEVEFSANGEGTYLPSGVYLYRLSVDNTYVETKKMILLK